MLLSSLRKDGLPARCIEVFEWAQSVKPKGGLARGHFHEFITACRARGHWQPVLEACALAQAQGGTRSRERTRAQSVCSPSRGSAWRLRLAASHTGERAESDGTC